ncbi:hypothetical protein FQR65_LT12395 [Abscondita terminalis]|nr:hypothetical protein FQR65_LT12395 [Abscondita terminalis]
MNEADRLILTKRSGTDNVGKEYELKIVALLALRCIENPKVKHAWIASNIENGGAFDDVFLYVNDVDDVGCVYLIQLKHQYNRQNIPRRDFLYDVEKKKKKYMKEDFSLFHYRRSYVTIQSSLRQDDCKKEDDFVATLRKVDKIFYLLYTDRPLGVEHEFINVCRDFETPVDIKTGKEKIYEFKNCSEFEFQDDFLRNFKLFTEQAHITEVDGFIKTELKRIANAVKIHSLDVNNLYESYMNFARANVQKVQVYFEALTTTDIIQFLTSFFLNHYQVKEFSLKCSIEPQFTVWKKIIDGKNLVVVNSTAKNFLESYVSASIAEHFKFDNWNQHLSKTILDQTFPYLKSILTKMIGDGDLTVSLVYEALWLQGRVPFLVRVDKPEDLNCIRSVQCLMRNFSYQVIVLTNFWIDILDSPNCLFNLNHLDYERQKIILAHPITLQKRRGACLANLINKSMYKFVQCNEMIDIIMDRYNIGDAQGKELKYYILRSVSKRTYTCTKDIREEQLIQPHILFDNFSDLGNKWMLIEQLISQNLCVINAYPGMGKTEFFNHAALNAPTNLWVIKIILNKHNDYYESVKKSDQSFSDHLDYFCGKNISHELTKRIFCKFVKQKNVLVLLDGFDEINMMYVKEVTSIAKSFSENGFKVWVSTRPVTKEHLEKALNTVSRTLKPLSISDQRKFLNEYYKDLGKDVETINKFIEKLLKAATDNLRDADNKFTGLPLQTKLLADVFEDDLKRNLETNDFVFRDKFDLAYLYESFLEKKNKLLNARYRDNFVNVHQTFEEFQKLGALLHVFPENLSERFQVNEKFYECLKYYAPMNVIGREGVMWVDSVTSKVSFVHKTFAEFLAAKWLYENWKTQGLSDFIKCRFTNGYEFVFSVFDQYVAKHLPLHSTIISKNSERTLELIKSNQEFVGLKDECKRTVWHLFSCYLSDDETLSILKQLPENIEIDDVDKLLEFNALEYAICNTSYSTANKLCQMSEKLSLKSIDLIPTVDNVFNLWTGYEHLFLRVLPHFARLALLLNYHTPISLPKIDEYYHFTNHSWRSFEDVQYKSTKKAQQFSVSSFISNDRLYEHYRSKYPWQSLIDFVRYKYSDDVMVAAAHGDIKDFSRTLKINYTDIYNYTALHYASIHNNLPNVMYIISESKKIGEKEKTINFQGRDKNTALLLALREKNLDVANFLIKKGADLTLANGYSMTPFLYLCKSGDTNVVKNTRPKIENINLQNREGRSALHLAITHRNNDVARFFIDIGVDVNLTDRYGMTAFHYACQLADIDVVKKMLPNVTDINLQSSIFKNTALNMAFMNRNKDIGPFLIDEGADISLKDRDGMTAFHYACRSADIEIVKKVRPNVPDIDLQSFISARSALHLAIINKNVNTTRFLIDEGADINLSDHDGMTPFLYACQILDIDFVKKMKPNVDDINLRSYSGRSALHLALMNGNKDIAKFLVDEGADVNLTDCEGMTAFFYACELADIEVVKKMRPKIEDINLQRVFDMNSALHLVSMNQNFDIAQFLIDEGADINLTNYDGMTAFHYACLSGDNDMAKKMYTNVADINLKGGLVKRTALHLAFMSENKDVAEFLIDEGADINLTDSDGITAFMRACKLADIDIVKKMRPNVADMNLQCNCNKRSALHFAFINKNEDIARFLIDEGADINLTDNEGMTAFLCACETASVDVVKKMRPNVADIKLQCNSDKKTALHLASINRNNDVARFLVDEGADINLTDNQGMTAFLYACKSGDIDIVKKMRSHVENINLQCSLYKRSALHLAFINKNIAIAQYLIDEGADVNLTDCYGMTPFFCACQSADIDIVKKMRPNVADINQQCKFGEESTLNVARMNKNKDVAQLLFDNESDTELTDFGGTPYFYAHILKDIEFANILRANVADINLENNFNKKSALHVAFINKNKDIAGFLIDEGADINLTDCVGMTAFHYACELSDIDIVKKMRPNVADINLQCSLFKRSALHLALVSKNKDVAEFLMAEGADVNSTDCDGMTAFHYACLSEDIGIVKKMYPNVTDINLQCSLYKTSALHLAFANKNTDIAQFLIDEGADVNLIDCNGMTAFHHACNMLDIGIVKKMHPNWQALI